MSSKSRLTPAQHEIFQGMAAKWVKYLPLALICAGFCASVYGSTRFFASIGEADVTPSTMDYLLYLFKGMEVYIPGPDSPFDIPYIWMVPNLYVAFMTASYPTRDLSGFGKHILMRSGTRTGWYLNKCGWVTANVLVCYLMIYLPPLLFSLFTGNLSFASGGAAMRGVLGADYGMADPAALLRAVIFLPILTSLALSLLQMLLEFVLRPIFGFAIIACLLVTSAYLYTPALIGNFSIFLRSEFVMGAEGLRLIQGVIINLCLIAAAVIAGCLYFRKHDILDKS